MQSIDDLCNILISNASSKRKKNESEDAPVLKAFKYFDLQDESIIDYKTFLKSLERLGLVSNKFNEHLFIELFNSHSENNLFDYTNFIITLYPVPMSNIKKLMDKYI